MFIINAVKSETLAPTLLPRGDCDPPAAFFQRSVPGPCAGSSDVTRAPRRREAGRDAASR